MSSKEADLSINDIEILEEIDNIEKIKNKLKTSKCYYAVKQGRIPGVYSTWEECSAQVKNHPGSKCKTFRTESEAVQYFLRKRFVRKNAANIPKPFDDVTNHIVNDSQNIDCIHEIVDNVHKNEHHVRNNETTELKHVSDVSNNLVNVSKYLDNVPNAPKYLDNVPNVPTYVNYAPNVPKYVGNVAKNVSKLLDDDIEIVGEVRGSTIFTIVKSNNAEGNCGKSNHIDIQTSTISTIDKLKNANAVDNCDKINHIIVPASNNIESVNAPKNLGNPRKRKQPVHENFLSHHVSKNKRRKLARERLRKNIGMFKTNIGEEEDTLYIYTDGAYRNNKAGIGVYFGKDHLLNLSERITGLQNSSRAETMAVVRALEQVKQFPELISKKIVLFTDSQNVISNFETVVKGGRKNYNDDYDLMKVVMQGLNVKMLHVSAHCGVLGNELADDLAASSLVLPDV